MLQSVTRLGLGVSKRRQPRDVAQSVGEWTIVGLTTLAAVSGTLVHGGTDHQIYGFLQVLLGTIGIGGILLYGYRMRLLWLPISIAVVGILQLVEWPLGVLETVSPISAQAWETASQMVGQPLPKRITVAPGETGMALRQLFVMAVFFTAIAELSHDHRKAMVLAWVVALVGLVVFIWGLAEWVLNRDLLLPAQWMRWPFGYKNPMLHPMQTAAFGRSQITTVGSVNYSATYWVVGDMFGPYLVSNHFAGCLELTFPLFLGLLFTPRVIDQIGAKWSAICLVGLLGVVLSVIGGGASARAGVAGILIGWLWVLWGLSRGHWRVVTGLAFMSAISCCVILFFVSLFANRFPLRSNATFGFAWLLSQLVSLIGGAEWRTSQWLVCFRMFRESPWFGLGLGSYAVASPFFTTSNVYTGFAHCDYFQLLAEAGVIGAGLILATVGYVAVRISRDRFMFCQKGSALQLGLSGSLVAFLPHGLVDWNLHIPANAILFVIVAGLFLGSFFQPKAELVVQFGHLSCWKILRFGVAAFTIVGCLVCITGAIQHARNEKDINPLRHALLSYMWPKSTLCDSEKQRLLMEALPQGISAARREPRNAEYARLVGLAYLHLSRGKDTLALKEAEEWLMQAVSHSPLSLSLYSTIAEIRLAQIGSTPRQSDEQIR